MSNSAEQFADRHIGPSPDDVDRMLRALGVTRSELAVTIIAQSSWLGAAGLVMASVFSLMTVAIARAADVPMAPSGAVGLSCAVGVMAVAWLSGLFCISRLAQADPGALLRT